MFSYQQFKYEVRVCWRSWARPNRCVYVCVCETSVVVHKDNNGRQIARLIGN